MRRPTPAWLRAASRLLLTGCFGCAATRSACGDAPATTTATSGAVAPSATGVASAPNGGVLTGSCEASAMVPWEGGWLVGDNEVTGHLFAYGPDFSRRPDVPLATAVDDLEALALDGARVLAEGSYSRTNAGEERLSRQVSAWTDGPAKRLDFGPACPACAGAALLDPNHGGLNVEGAAFWGGDLWLGLRSPLLDGKAQLLDLPGGLDGPGVATRAVLLDLGGRGVRELTPWHGGLLVVAGPPADGGEPHRLYWLADTSAAPVDLDVTLPPSTEGIGVESATSLVYVTDGDGKKEPCKAPATWGRLPVRLP